MRDPRLTQGPLWDCCKIWAPDGTPAPSVAALGRYWCRVGGCCPGVALCCPYMALCCPGPDPIPPVAGERGCAFCGGLGHRITNCPKLEAMQTKQVSNIGRKDYLAHSSMDF